MKIVAVSHFFASHGGGIERVAGRLCLEMARAGHQVRWAASASDPPPTHPLVDHHPIACINPVERITGLPLPLPRVGGLLAMSRLVRDADVVMVHDALYATSLAAIVFARRHAKPLILVQHIADVPFVSKALRVAMRVANLVVTRGVMRTVDQVVFISEEVRRSFATTPFRRPPRVLFNGVDTTIFQPGAAQREHFGFGRLEKVVAFAGRMVQKKGLSVIEALARRRPDLSFALAGSGPIDPATWNLRNVRVLGALDQQALARLFRSVDVLLLPSVGEGFPLVIQEAMACGLPVICGEESARADPDASAFLKGVRIDLADPSGCAARVEDALADVGLGLDRLEMARYAALTYSWPGMARALLELAAGCR